MISMHRDLEIDLSALGSLENRKDVRFFATVPEELIPQQYAVLGIWKKGRAKVWYPYQPKVYEVGEDRDSTLNTFHELIATWDKKDMRRSLCLVVAKKSDDGLELEAASFLKKGKPHEREVDWFIR